MTHMSDVWHRPALSTLIVVAAAMVGIVAVGDRAVAAPAPHDISLSTDATGALVTATRIAPGALPARCVRVSYADAIGGETLALFATATGNGLAKYLDVTVDVGRAGGYATCSGFQPASTLFSGTLADLARQHGDGASAIATATLDAGSGDATFRFRFSLRNTNAAQGLTAGADFVWVAWPPTAPSPTPTPSRSPTPTPTPTAPPTPTPSSDPAPPPSPTASALPVLPPSSPPPSASNPSVSVPLTPPPAPKAPNLVSRVLNAVTDAAAPVVRGTAVGLAALPVVLMFLLVQSRIDRRDPKLALAPAHSDPDLSFDEVPRSAR